MLDSADFKRSTSSHIARFLVSGIICDNEVIILFSVLFHNDFLMKFKKIDFFFTICYCILICFSFTSRSFTRHSRVDLDSDTQRLSVPVRTACTIVRAARSIDYAEQSVAQRKHRNP